MTTRQDGHRRGAAENATQRARLRALPPERRAALLDPAEAEFAANGYEAASLNRILAAAGMSKGQAYYYIADKADLYGAVIERALDRLASRIDLRFGEPSGVNEFWEQIGGFLAALTRLLSEDERLATLARGIYEGPRTQAALAGPMRRIRMALDRTVSTGRALGAIRTDIPHSLLVDTLLATARGVDAWFAEHWHELDLAEALELNEKTLGMIRAMAAPPATPQPTGDEP